MPSACDGLHDESHHRVQFLLLTLQLFLQFMSESFIFSPKHEQLCSSHPIFIVFASANYA